MNINKNDVKGSFKKTRKEVSQIKLEQNVA
jgi:hypothetical protein